MRIATVIRRLFGSVLTPLAAFCLCASGGCSTGRLPAPEPAKAEAFQKTVGALASREMAGRAVASPQGRRAAELIAGEMAGAGLSPAGEDGGWFDAFDVDQRVLAAPHNLREFLRPSWRRLCGQGRNVVGFLLSTTEGARTIVVGAHYDHLPVTGEHARDFGVGVRPGADDNAGGVAVLLMVARRLARQPQRRFNYLLVAFDGEEFGFLGSRDFVKRRQVSRRNVACMICLDQVGRMRSRRLYVLGNVLRPQVATQRRRRRGNRRRRQPHDRTPGPGPLPPRPAAGRIPAAGRRTSC